VVLQQKVKAALAGKKRALLPSVVSWLPLSGDLYINIKFCVCVVCVCARASPARVCVCVCVCVCVGATLTQASPFPPTPVPRFTQRRGSRALPCAASSILRFSAKGGGGGSRGGGGGGGGVGCGGVWR